ncbi:hydrogenase nickel incorporation protein HypB [Ancylobacter lacus]|uniref:hydrogenase nickel incorporation protein HypB n=1 Tax=Ancylobacter lacus TaxID=2579970 RepID=UPI001BCB125E|nr:hydrogenase nickel incorporation protein HypB [Ancylobacter lacus]MBS7537522.1 hydrogenase nickel incorporation protein HypB [Ancylobacter lacus]
MCVSCGCGSHDVTISGAHGEHRHHAHGHDHSHVHGDEHHHHGEGAGTDATRTVEIERGILAKNDAYAARNRARLNAGGIVALNLLAGPGAGKTTLLVETLRILGARVPAAVIEGDQQTANDAERIRATGTPAVQINTGKGCHLDAHMVGHALDELPLPPGGLLFIENVGNLVCPAAFDLGEEVRVTLLSVTEGEDKPLKYPDIFQSADLVLLTKTDLLPHLDVDIDAMERNIARINPVAPVLHVSTKTGGIGLAAWLGWLGDIRRRRLDGLAAAAESRAKSLRAAAEALP